MCPPTPRPQRKALWGRLEEAATAAALALPSRTRGPSTSASERTRAPLPPRAGCGLRSAGRASCGRTVVWGWTWGPDAAQGLPLGHLENLSVLAAAAAAAAPWLPSAGDELRACSRASQPRQPSQRRGQPLTHPPAPALSGHGLREQGSRADGPRRGLCLLHLNSEFLASVSRRRAQCPQGRLQTRPNPSFSGHFSLWASCSLLNPNGFLPLQACRWQGHRRTLRLRRPPNIVSSVRPRDQSPAQLPRGRPGCM